jgi:hypothetical protein
VLTLCIAGVEEGNPEPVTRASPGAMEAVMLFVVELSCVVMVKALPFKPPFVVSIKVLKM